MSFCFFKVRKKKKGKRREGRRERRGGGEGWVGGETVKQIILLSSPVSLEATQVPYTKLRKLYAGLTKILPRSPQRF